MVLGTALAACLTAAPAARAQAPLPTIVQDDAQLLNRTDDQTRASLAKLQSLGVSTVRVTAGWSVLTRDPDDPIPPIAFDQTDPAAYDNARFRGLDRLDRLAPHYGLTVMIDIAFWAPHWATVDPPGPRARTDVDPAAYARFATAIARRYDGSFEPAADAAADTGDGSTTADDRFMASLYGTPVGGLPGGLLPPSAAAVADTPLPAVTTFTLWNEPNHPAFLMPQWAGRGATRHPVSPDIYRSMVQAAYPAVKAVQPGSTVLIGATAAQSSGTKGVAPLTFLRRLACVDENLDPVTDGSCASFTQLPGDGWSHHPYSLKTLPSAHSSDPDQVPIGDLGRLTGLLGKLVASGRLAPGLANVWITEYGYETNPPSVGLPYSTGDQARFLTWAEYLAWRQPHVVSFAQFLLDDLPPSDNIETGSARRAHGEWYSGLLFSDGQPKLAASSFADGVYVHPTSRRGRLLAWGRLRTVPVGQTRQVEVEIQRSGSGGYHAVKSTAPTGGGAAETFTSGTVVSRAFRAPRSARYRLRYQDANGAWLTTPSVGLFSAASS